jgi:hypothetical protein
MHNAPSSTAKTVKIHIHTNLKPKYRAKTTLTLDFS